MSQDFPENIALLALETRHVIVRGQDWKKLVVGRNLEIEVDCYLKIVNYCIIRFFMGENN